MLVACCGRGKRRADAELPVSTRFKVIVPPAAGAKRYKGLARAYNDTYRLYSGHLDARVSEADFHSVVHGVNAVIEQALNVPWWQRDVEEAADQAVAFLQSWNRAHPGVFWRLRRSASRKERVCSWLEVELLSFNLQDCVTVSPVLEVARSEGRGEQPGDEGSPPGTQVVRREAARPEAAAAFDDAVAREDHVVVMDSPEPVREVLHDTFAIPEPEPKLEQEPVTAAGVEERKPAAAAADAADVSQVQQEER